MYDPNKITYIGETDSRNRRLRFGIKAQDRTKHVYIIGKTGMGKSTLLENMAVQDIQNGEGFAFIDPHGKTAELLLDYVPEERIQDVLYFAPFDNDYPISFNVMEDVGYDKRHLVASGLMSAFKKIWVDAWSARMEYILNNVILALLEYPDSSLLSVNRMLTDKAYRKKVVDHVSDPSVRSFWVDEFAKYTEKFAAEATPAIQNKVGQFVSNPIIRNIIGQPKSSFDLREMMDNQKIIIINLSKGRIGESNSNLLGSMLITKIYLAAMSRADIQESELKKMPNFYLYVDEFQSFANESFADILSEARKYKLNLTIAHQYVEQMSEEVRAAVFGNVGTTIAFRVGPFDAEILEKVFSPKFTQEDIVNLGFTQIYLSLMIDGVGSVPFSATTLPPIALPENSLKEKIMESSRRQYARPRAEVEDEIVRWHENGGIIERAGVPLQEAKTPAAPASAISDLARSRPASSLGPASSSANAGSRNNPKEKGASKKSMSDLRDILESLKKAGPDKAATIVPEATLAESEDTVARNDDDFVSLDMLKQKVSAPGAAMHNARKQESQEERRASAPRMHQQHHHEPPKRPDTTVRHEERRENPVVPQNSSNSSNYAHTTSSIKTLSKSKEATEENLAGLRNALAFVLGEDDASDEAADSKPNSQKKPSEQERMAREEHREIPEKRSFQASSSQPSNFAHSQKKDSAPPENLPVEEIPTVHTSSPQVSQQPAPKELPEDLLRKILEVNDDAR